MEKTKKKKENYWEKCENSSASTFVDRLMTSPIMDCLNDFFLFIQVSDK